MWNLPPPPGFQGLREDLPLRYYERHLPHWRQDGATYFVTFRLADSLLPGHRLELQRIRSDWLQKHPQPHSRGQLEELARLLFVEVETSLDEGFGDCRLKNIDAAQAIAGSMHHFDDTRYVLGCYVVMPNHVHVVVQPLVPGDELEDILKGWKSFSAIAINRLTNERGPVWQDESYDRIVRHEEQLWRTIQYIGRNPKKAGLLAEKCLRWVRPQWVKLGWGFRDEE